MQNIQHVAGTPRTAVIGGGINALTTAWALARRGHTVDLFERDTLMRATSQASTKLLHGGLRYLEHGDLRLVRESLHERSWWLTHAPHLAHPIPLYLPIGPHSARPRWLVGLGLTLYDLLAGRQNVGRHSWHPAAELARLAPNLNRQGVTGAYRFYDLQMDDYALGMWVAGQAREAGVRIHEHTPVTRVTTTGMLTIPSGDRQYHAVINVAGPWARQLLTQSGIPSKYDLTLVRGSHILLEGTLPAGFFLPVPGETRIVFALPYQGQIMVGTTEIPQTLDDPIVCSAEERAYLLQVYNAYFTDTRTDADILGTFAGVRPLVQSGRDRKPATRVSREYAIERNGRLVTVFGGKWTTARVLGEKVAEVVETVS